MKTKISRRSALGKMAAGAAAASVAASLTKRMTAAETAAGAALKGRINHSVCKWCYPKVSLEDLCTAGKEMGLQSVELLTVDDFPTLRKHGLICAMVSGVPGGITDGLNRPENQERIVSYFEEVAPRVANAGFRNIICFSGNRKGMSDEEGLAAMELLNSKVDHKDYMCDHTKWGVELVKRVGSEYFKLLYDIYHMQIMEGDVIRTIRENREYIAHYHTGGVPGRHEIDDTQELNYATVMKAIVETGFKGHVAQEFIPARPDVLASLKQGVQICDV